MQNKPGSISRSCYHVRKSVDSSRNKFGGILTRKERWSLSSRGWLLLCSIAFVVFYLLLVGIHPFLAVTHRVDANALVVENWVHEPAIRTSVEEFKTGRYKYVFTTGGLAVGSGNDESSSTTAASINADW